MGLKWGLIDPKWAKWGTNGVQMEANGVHMHFKSGSTVGTKASIEALWGSLGHRWSRMRHKIVPNSIPKSIDRGFQFLTNAECLFGAIWEPRMALRTALIPNHPELDTVAIKDHVFFKTYLLPEEKPRFM